MNTLWHSLSQPYFQRAVLEVVLVGALAGAISVHVLLRRLPFFVVAMSHATFPGIVLASVLGVSLFVGGAAFGLLVVLAIAAVGQVRSLDDSSATGVVLAGAFAIGVLIVSARAGASKDLSAYLVGQALTVSRGDVVTTASVGLVLCGVLAALHKELVHGAFDHDGLAALGYPVRGLDLTVLVIVTVAMVASVPAVGTLLATALLTVPAMVARAWCRRVGPMLALGAATGVASGVAGLAASAIWNVAAGGAIALSATGLFVASALVRALLGAAGRTGAGASHTPVEAVCET